MLIVKSTKSADSLGVFAIGTSLSDFVLQSFYAWEAVLSFLDVSTISINFSFRTWSRFIAYFLLSGNVWARFHVAWYFIYNYFAGAVTCVVVQKIIVPSRKNCKLEV